MYILQTLKKIDVDSTQEYTVFEMIENSDINALKKYIREGGNINKSRYLMQKNCFFAKSKRVKISLLYQAVYMGNIAIIQILLANSVYVSDMDADALAKSVIY